MALTPLFLTVVTLSSIRCILAEFLTVILRTALALATGATADDLVRVIAGRCELFFDNKDSGEMSSSKGTEGENRTATIRATEFSPAAI